MFRWIWWEIVGWILMYKSAINFAVFHSYWYCGCYKASCRHSCHLFIYCLFTCLLCFICLIMEPCVFFVLYWQLGRIKPSQLPSCCLLGFAHNRTSYRYIRRLNILIIYLLLKILVTILYNQMSLSSILNAPSYVAPEYQWMIWSP